MAEQAMFVLKGLETSIVQQDVVVVERVERAVRIADGDEVYCLVVGKAHRIGNTPEIEIRQPTFVRVLEVRKP